ncbi:MAG: acyl-CoA dehydrogenase family protein, partial [Acidimicrobiia bacterium]
MIGWSDEQEEMRLAVRRFVEAEIAPIRDDLEHGDLPPYEVLRRYYATFGLDEMARDRFESESSGKRDQISADDARERRYERAIMTLLPMIEISRHCPGLVTALGVSTNLAGGSILRKATPEQARRWALPLLTLEKVGAWAITEPDSGSDAFGGMRSSAVRDGDSWVLNGSKTFITNGPFADIIVFLCKLDDGSPWRERPVLTFVLDRGMDGLEQTKPLRKMGLHSSPTGEVFARDVRVGPERLLGSAGGEARGSSGGANSAAGRDAARSVFASER